MQVAVNNKDIFPDQVLELLQAFHSVGFFEESMLIGSWALPLYQEAFGINYILRTMDIDFAVKFICSDKGKKVDIEKIITDLGYLSVVMQSGIRKFTREDFTVEFIAHRAGQLDLLRLKAVVEYFKPSKKTQKTLRVSCEAIDFPPQRLGL